MIPPDLIDVARYLSDLDFQLVTSAQDARRDSGDSETHVVQLLQNSHMWRVFSPNVDRGNNRTWYDAKINDFYVDIKISECSANDNTNAKKAIYYLLTGKPPEKVPDMEKRFFRAMRDSESPDETRDYYYLIVNKRDLSDIFVVNLKGLPHASPSANNMPFQANWGRCRKPRERSWHEARDFLLNAWAESIRRATKKYREGMVACYPEFFDKDVP